MQFCLRAGYLQVAFASGSLNVDNLEEMEGVVGEWLGRGPEVDC